jgi:hypothetical protein
MSRNPYHQLNSGPELLPSVLAFIDILGYQQLIAETQAKDNQQVVLERLHRALSDGRKGLEDAHESLQEIKKIVEKDIYVLKAFTDNIVIAWPIRDDAEIELGSALSKLIDFQFLMTIEGFFIRGAIAIGQAYVDDVVVFGDALIEAYSGESKLARDPRIVLTDLSTAVTKKHLSYYGSGHFSPQARYLLCDSDGQWFVNYLECVLNAEDEAGADCEAFIRHKKAVETKLAEFRTDPPIFSKYAWVANYHNYFCEPSRSPFLGRA